MRNPSPGLMAIGLGVVVAALILGPNVYGLLVPFEASVREERLEVSAYPLKRSRISIRLAEIDDVELLVVLPEGFSGLEPNSLLGRWRGWYTVEGLGKVVVLLESEQPPFVYVRGIERDGTQDKQLLLRWRDERATRDLFDTLQAELQRRAVRRAE